VDDIYSGQRVPAISGPERDRLYRQRDQLEQELQGLQARYDEMARSVLFGQPAPQSKPQPKPQPQAQPKQPPKQPQQQQKPSAPSAPKQGTLPSGRKFVIE